MTYSEPTRPTPRWIPIFVVAGLLAVIAVTAAAIGYRLPAAPFSGPSSTTVSPIDSRGSDPRLGIDGRGGGAPVAPQASREQPPAVEPQPAVRAAESMPPRLAPGGEQRRGVPGEAHGMVPDGVTVFDDGYPAVANLAPDLLRALRRAATDAAEDGVAFVVTSGWRSPAYQEQLRREAVQQYGSEKEAARWVSTPDTSMHVSGDAVDIGPAEAMAWLSKHGAGYGLCQIYRNEPWHFELHPEAVTGACPRMYADPTHDPRTQR